MKTIVISPAALRIPIESDIHFIRSRKRWSHCLLLSAIVGIVTGITGLVLAGASLLHFISPYGGLGIAGTALLAVTFPILIFQAHCLDMIEGANRGQRMANYKRRILSDSDRSLFK